MPVTKDHQRHYAAISAEVEAIQKAPWTCLVCQTVNSGPLSEGCVTCGSGAQGARKAPPEPPKPPRNFNGAATPISRGVTHLPPEQAALAAAARFLQQQPTAGVIDAYLAGYAEALRELRDGLREFRQGLGLNDTMTGAQVPPTPPPPPPPPFDRPPTPEVGSLAPEGKAARTILAALALFRDQVLVEGPEEIATGEWCSVEDVNGLIAQLTEEQHGYDTSTTDLRTPDDADRDDLF